jgi:hypothetical protein
VDTYPHLNLVARIERAIKTNSLLTEVHLIVKKRGEKGSVEARYSGTTHLRRSF